MGGVLAGQDEITRLTVTVLGWTEKPTGPEAQKVMERVIWLSRLAQQTISTAERHNLIRAKHTAERLLRRTVVLRSKLEALGIRGVRRKRPAKPDVLGGKSLREQTGRALLPNKFERFTKRKRRKDLRSQGTMKKSPPPKTS